MSDGLRQRNKQEKLLRLKQAALSLFAEKGFHTATIREIAERAGIGVGTVFLYARDKQDLLFLLFHEVVAAVQQQAFASLDPEQPLLDQLVHVFGRFYEHYATDPALSRLFVKELLFLPEGRQEEMSAMVQESMAHLAGLVFRAQARGEVRPDVEPLRAAVNFFSAYYMGLLTLLDGTLPSAAEARRFLRMSLELQLRGIGGR